MPELDPRTPVLVGVGTCLDDVEAAELMVRATIAAADDAGAPSLLAAVQQVVVPRGTWSYSDPARLVAARIGARHARTVLVDLGIPQQALIDDAMRAILDGSLDVAVVVGGEAKARAARALRASRAADASGIIEVVRRNSDANALETDQGGARPDVYVGVDPDVVVHAELAAGLLAPVEQYALIESALRRARDESVPENRRAVARLCAQANAVARQNPEAAFPDPMSEDDLATLGPANRPLAFPYGKWHASQWTVDQGAALFLCSAEAASRHGVPRERWVFPRVGLTSSLAISLSRRRDLHRWPAMQVLGRAAAEHVGRPIASCEHVELYSCFPSAVRVQQAELGLDAAAATTITGGMTFAGGPFNNFVLQATAAMARRLRERRGLGLVTTVSGFLTKPGLAVWSDEPGPARPLVADLRDDAAVATPTVEVLDAYDGVAVVAACTVAYEGHEPARVVAILDTPDGARAVATSDARGLAARATEEELVGEKLRVDGNLLLP